MSFDYSSIDLRSLYVETGAVAATLSDGEIFQFRWTHATQRVVVPLVKVSALQGTAFTAGTGHITLAKATGWSVDGTGGATTTLTGGQGKLDTNISAQHLPGVRTATTAALGAGTKTIVANHGGVVFGVPAAAGTTLLDEFELFSDLAVVARPIILNQNEGLIIRATAPATGTLTVGIQVVWGVV